jgi:peptidylprolyl isomerase
MAFITSFILGLSLLQQGPPKGPAAQSGATKSVAELKITDVKIGTGPAVVRGDQIFVEYTGTLANGKTFDANKGGKPFVVAIGLNYVIPGWDKGLIGMKVGGTRKLVIPPDQAYGNHQAGAIPPNSTLFFTIKLKQISHPIQRVKVTIDKAGDGAGATWGDKVNLTYTGKLANGTQFDSNVGGPAPLEVELGRSRLIIGFTLGTLGIKMGESRTITIPSDLGYGTRQRDKIPANSTLVFTVTRVAAPTSPSNP